MSLSHSAQKTDKQNNSLNAIIQFLDTINDVQQKYGSFENAEQEIRGLVVELEKSMVQETLSQYDINTPIVVRDGQVYRQVLRQNKTYTSAAGLLTSSALYTVQKGNAFAHWNYKPVLLRTIGHPRPLAWVVM